jgi:guanylate kinase
VRLGAHFLVSLPFEKTLQESFAVGILFIVCGPSGVGKTSLGRVVRERHERLVLSVSYTTRAPRENERDGIDYHFVDMATFEQMREAGAFAEWAMVHGNAYATPKSAITSAWEAGEDVFFDIDYQGAAQLDEAFPVESVSVLVAPPSMQELEARLRGRQTDSEETIQRRLRNAREELEQHALFDFILFNDDFDAAADALERIYMAAQYRNHLRKAKLEALLART